MAKSKFFRVAVEGATTDGRTIERRWIAEAAKNYNPETYAARVNVEHIRGISPMRKNSGEDGFGAFGSYGDVIAVKAEEIDFTLGDKTEKRLALFAQIDALEPLIELNARKQKLFTSIEIRPEFADSGEAYLVGLAVTDSPASLGTEMLAFAAGQGENNPLAGRKQHPDNLFTAAIEAEIEIEDESAAGNPADPTGIFASLKGLIERLSGATATGAPAADPATPANPDFAAEIRTIAAAVEATASTVADLSAQFAALETRNAEAEATAAAEAEAEAEAAAAAPAQSFTSLEPATGGAVAEHRSDY